MNTIKAKVLEIQSVDNLTIVTFETHNHTLRMMSLDLKSSIKIGSEVLLGAKASNISLAKSISGEISISNRLNCIVESIDKGELLCSLKLRFNDSYLESIITLKSFLYMNIKVADNILALIKASELSILEQL